MAVNLKGKQVEALRDALVSAFPQYTDLQMMLLFELSEDLGTHVGPGGMNTVATQLILWARANGRLDELIAGARAQRPGNPELHRFSIEVALTSDGPLAGRLEAVVLKNVPFQHVAQWRDRMARKERCVCRVEIPEGTGVGTGFLVGPDTILTNWHVAKIIEEAGLRPEQAGVRFDYAAGADGLTIPAGRFYHFAVGGPLDKSTETELDFALLRLEGEPGREAMDGNGEPRGWLKYKPQKIEIGEVQLILQHPLAAPLNLSAGVVTAVNNLHKRVTYTANTEFGSSGSPVFTLAWELTALHHYGQATGNMGIPMSYIWPRLTQEGWVDDPERG